MFLDGTEIASLYICYLKDEGEGPTGGEKRLVTFTLADRHPGSEKEKNFQGEKNEY